MSELEKTILIIDDETSIRQSLADYFADRQWRTLEAESGEEALEILAQESPHGAIVDIRLGGMDGDTFIREAHKKRPNMVIIICTGSPEYDVPADLLRMPGVSGSVFRKPITDMAKLEKELNWKRIFYG